MQPACSSQYHGDLLTKLLSRNTLFCPDHNIGSKKRIPHIDESFGKINWYKSRFIHATVAYSAFAFLLENSYDISFAPCNYDLFSDRIGSLKKPFCNFIAYYNNISP